MAQSISVHNLKPGDWIETHRGMRLVLGSENVRSNPNSTDLTRVDITVRDAGSQGGFDVLVFGPKDVVECDMTSNSLDIIAAARQRVELTGK